MFNRIAATLAALAFLGERFAVGGCVRDTLQGLEPFDVDVATPLHPGEVMRRAGAEGVRVISTGLAHGTVTLLLGGGAVEVTTYRRDVATDGRHATVRFSETLLEDLARRDFTINALAVDPTGNLIGAGWTPGPQLHAYSGARFRVPARDRLHRHPYSAAGGSRLKSASGGMLLAKS